MPLLLAFLTAFAVSAAATPLARRMALRFGFADKPNPRRSGPLKPRLGGVAIFLGFAAALALAYPLLPGRTAEEVQRVTGLALAGLLVLVVGVIDDKLDLPAWPQFAAQIGAALLAMGSGILIEKITNPFGFSATESLIFFPEGVALAFTLFWLVGAMNTINFLDGIDGLAAGVVMVAAFILAAHAWLLGQLTIALLPLALAGACLGFLPYNFQPARITMGTCGSMFLGFTIGALAIIGGAKAATLLLVLGLPVVDTGWTILRRLASGQSPLRGDRTHLHHRLLALGLGERQIVLGMYAASLALGILALLLSTRLAKLYAIGFVAAGTVLLAIALPHAARRRQRAGGG